MRSFRWNGARKKCHSSENIRDSYFSKLFVISFFFYSSSSPVPRQTLLAFIFFFFFQKRSLIKTCDDYLFTVLASLILFSQTKLQPRFLYDSIFYALIDVITSAPPLFISNIRFIFPSFGCFLTINWNVNFLRKFLSQHLHLGCSRVSNFILLITKFSPCNPIWMCEQAI